ncbi:MAG: EAL domain-containing protein [Pseudomonadota bacterium]
MKKQGEPFGALERQLRVQLAESNSLVDAAFEAVVDGIMVVDCHGNITHHNRRLLDLFHLPAPVFERFDEGGFMDYLRSQMKDSRQQLHRLDAPITGEQAGMLEFRDGRVFECHIIPRRVHDHIAGYVWSFRDVTAPQRVLQTLQNSERYLLGMERVSRIIARNANVDDMIRDLVREVRDIFAADRAWLLHPCDPEAPAWSVPVECTAPGHPGAFSEGAEIATDAAVAAIFREVNASAQPLCYTYTADTPHADFVVRYQIQSQIVIGLRPKIGAPWVLGLHQCNHPRQWTAEEQRLLHDIARRLEKALSIRLLLQCLENDVAARKAAEQRLLESEQYLQTLLAALPYGVEECDLDGVIRYANPALHRMLGYDTEELIGRRIWEFIADDAAREQAMLGFAAIIERQPSPATYHVRKRARDGQVLNVKVDWDYKRDAHGRLKGFVGIVTDITEHKAAEEKLRLAERVFESTVEGVVITNREGKIVAVNKAFSKITGYTEEEVIGNNPRFLASGRHDKTFYKAMWESIGAVGYWQGELWNRRKNGEVYPEWVTITSVKDSQGNVTHYAAVFTDISKEKRNENEIEWLAHYDPLTRLPNRLLLNARLLHAIEHARRSDSKVAVLLFDINRFRHVNETFGHQAGDEMLQEISGMLKAALREEDTLARRNGDEFALVLENLIDEDHASTVARKLIELFHQPLSFKGNQMALSVSIGISLYPRDGEDCETLMKHADAARHRAKEQGENNLNFYTSALTDRAMERYTLESALRHALTNQELRLHYQPQVSLDSGRIIGAEALIRWQHPELGLVSPMKFIPLAEETGLIVEIGHWVIQQACAQATRWRERGHHDFCIAVNASARQFRQGGLLHSVRTALEETGLPAHCLEIEIVESMLIEDSAEVDETLRQLRKLGVKLAIDDFGTGYSSLGYLRRFPLDKVKIDRSFIEHVNQSPDDAAIAKAVISMGHSLNMMVLAEGIEDEGQLNYLRWQHCDAIQGYYFSRPLPTQEFDELLLAGKTLPHATDISGSPRRCLLIVDDDTHVRNALQRLLRNQPYQLLLAASGPEGLQQLAKHRVDVIVTDYRMPQMDGVEFLTKVKALYPDTVRMMLSGYSDIRAVTDAINRGAIYKFIEKPWDDQQLLSYIRDAFRRRELEDENMRLRTELDRNRC